MERKRYTRLYMDGQAYVRSNTLQLVGEGEIVGQPIQELAMYESSGMSPIEVYAMRSMMNFYQQIGTPDEIARQAKNWEPESAIIQSFTRKHQFLSNFYPCSIEMDGLLFGSVEAAFQAAKCCDPYMKRQFVGLSASDARKKGRTVKMRSDWESTKVLVMESLVWQKFNCHPDLRDSLLSTGTTMLVEGNHWHDNYWGRCSCARCQEKEVVNYNNLGKILMRTRTKLRFQMQPHMVPLNTDSALMMQPEENGLSIQMMGPDGENRLLLALRHDPSELPGNQLMVELHLGGHPIKMYFGAMGQED